MSCHSLFHVANYLIFVLWKNINIKLDASCVLYFEIMNKIIIFLYVYMITKQINTLLQMCKPNSKTFFGGKVYINLTAIKRTYTETEYIFIL